MTRKGVKCPLGWTLLAENIEDVERVKLDTGTQRELGCVVGEHVFLEYPWAYVDRAAVARVAKLSTSPLASFRDRIAAYEADAFLVGYASDRLFSEDFAICLTVAARRVVVERNRIVTRAIWDRVIGKTRKTAAKSWGSLGSESEVDEARVAVTRQPFEIEIVLPGTAVGAARELCDRGSNDCRDSYLQLVNADEGFENVERRLICRSVQTHSRPRESYVQTYRGYLKNAWTQYAYEHGVQAYLIPYPSSSQLLDEYEKKHDFYDEYHEDGENEKHGGYHHEHEGKKGGHQKMGHVDSGHNEHRRGKKKKHEEGRHHRNQKGRKLAEGHDSHHRHEKKYGRKGGHESGKKWFASNGQ
ncbi:uncharacterized protein LOC144467662 [Augochlora pura]